MNRPEILVVDDSSTATLFMTDALRYAGYVVDTAQTGQEGLHKTLTLRPPCLILDIILPDVNGYTVCRRVRLVDPQHTIRIMFVSTKNTPIDRSYGLGLGADQYLAKPFTGELLVQTVEHLLPPHLRHIAVPTPPSFPHPYMRLSALLPRRREDTSLLATTNPFASSMRMDDAMHHLYKAIDGGRTVGTLCKVTTFAMPKVVQLLKVLFEQQRIEFWDPKRQVVVDAPFE